MAAKTLENRINTESFSTQVGVFPILEKKQKPI